jgi:ABC-type glycerol-3-phosphate transport system substrate-binding protein
MKRFALLLLAGVISTAAAGCGGDSASGGGGDDGIKYKRAEDSALPKEVREFEAQNAQRIADQNAKAAARKAGKGKKK